MMQGFSIEINLEDEYQGKFKTLLRHFIEETSWPKNIAKKALGLSLREIRLDGDEIAGLTYDDERSIKTKITLPLFDTFTIARCSCLQERTFLDEKPCSHQFAIAQELLKKLETVDQNQDFFKLMSDFETPDLAENNGIVTQNKKGIEWDITPDFKIEAYSSGKISLERLKHSKFELASDKDWKVLAIILDKGELSISRISELEAFLHVKLKETMGKSLQIIEVRFELCTAEEDGMIVSSLRFAGKEIKDNYLLADDGLAVFFDDHIVYQKTSAKELLFFRSIIENKPRVPIADKERLLRHLLAMESRIPISADKSLAEASNLPPDSSPRLRFSTIGQNAWLIEILVQPGKGSSFAPATGPELIFDLRSTLPSLVKRDFDEEIDQASQLMKTTPLGRLPGSSGRFFTESHDVILDIVKAATEQRIAIEWPKSGTIPKVIEHAEKPAISLTISDKNEWFEAQGLVEIGNEVISLKDLISHLRKEKRYIELASGAWIRISEEVKERTRRLEEILSADHASLTASSTLELIGEKDLYEIRQASDRFSKLCKTLMEPLDLALPEGLQANLRPYQLIGYEWLLSLSHRGLGGCLADDMGLGKTLQMIAVLLKNRNLGPSLVIAPVSLLHNWQYEIEKFAPQLKSQIWNGQGRHLGSVYQLGIDVTLTSFGTAVRDSELLKSFHWNTVVIDEAQNMKNPGTLNWKTVSALRSRWKMALSGTPVENKLEELWAILTATCPGVLGGRDEFKKRFEWPILRENSEKARDRLKARIKPFVLRRLKKDLLTELPPKTEINLWATPNEIEKNFYEACRLEALDRIKAQMGDEDGKDKLRFTVLASLQTLRQVACHPVLLNPEWNEGSAKTSVFLSTISELLENGHKVLVFSQFTRFLKLVREATLDRGISSYYLDGETSIEDRKNLVESFQNGMADVFFISLKAGGTGLNLTEADYVIHLDPWWNPAVEAQASDRAWRMGQKKPVTVYRMITEGSIEEKILALHAEKKFLSDDITSSATGDLDSLIALFGLQDNKRTKKNADREPELL